MRLIWRTILVPARIGATGYRPMSDDLSAPGLVGELSVTGVSSTPVIAPLRPVAVTASFERDLTPADLAALDAFPRGSPPKPLQRIRSSHHALARCLAIGLNPAKAALVTGYSTGRITALANDPAFRQLVEEYREDAKGVVADFTARMTNFGLDAMEELHERLLADPESFSIPALLDIVTKMADRTGHGTNSSVTHNFNLPTIDRPPREDFEGWKERRTRELTLVPNPVEPPDQGPPGLQGTRALDAGRRAPVASSD